MADGGQQQVVPSEGDNIKSVFPPVDGIQKLRLRAVGAAVELQLALGVPFWGAQGLGGDCPNWRRFLPRLGLLEGEVSVSPGPSEGSSAGLSGGAGPSH